MIITEEQAKLVDMLLQMSNVYVGGNGRKFYYLPYYFERIEEKTGDVKFNMHLITSNTPAKIKELIDHGIPDFSDPSQLVLNFPNE